MKKIVSMTLFALLLCAVFPVHPLALAPETAAAAETVVAYSSQSDGAPSVPSVLSGEGNDPFLEWRKTGYPDDVFGVSRSSGGFDPSDPDSRPGETTNRVYIAKGTGGERKDEIASLLGGRTVFVECSLTAEEKKTLEKEIRSAAGSLLAAVDFGIKDEDAVFILWYLPENEQAVKAAMEEKLSAYSSFLSFSAAVHTHDFSVIETVPEAARFVEEPNARPFLPFAGFAVFAVLVSLLSILLLRKRSVRVKSNGEEESDPSVKETEDAIRSDEISPSPAVRESVFRSIDREKKDD